MTSALAQRRIFNLPPGRLPGAAWAIVFGYSQQLFTRLIDQQAQNVLESLGSQAQPATVPT